MTRIIKLESLEILKNTKDPVIIFSMNEESEALKFACDENGIKVAAFCDNEIRKTKNPIVELILFIPLIFQVNSLMRIL